MSWEFLAPESEFWSLKFRIFTGQQDSLYLSSFIIFSVPCLSLAKLPFFLNNSCLKYNIFFFIIYQFRYGLLMLNAVCAPTGLLTLLPTGSETKWRFLCDTHDAEAMGGFITPRSSCLCPSCATEGPKRPFMCGRCLTNWFKLNSCLSSG